jgi:hypothetical protein
MIMICEADLCGSTWRSDLNKKFSIDLRKFFPLPRHIVFVIDSLNRADGFAGTTVNALIRLDIEHSVTFVDAIDWALFNAGFILHIDTWLGNHIRHEQPPGLTVWADGVEVTF